MQAGTVQFNIEGQQPITATKGFLVRISGKKNYDARNKPFVDFNGMIAEGKNPGGAFVYDDRAFANIIRGNPQGDNPKDKGHFHEVEMLHNYQPNAELR
jgi:hypothetical protein